MVVISLDNCPLALRGDLTKWLLEISPGVYVGQISARVRENIWERVCEECQNGRVTMVYSAGNEQHLDFRVHNSPWEPIDFDGLKLMLRPSPVRVKSLGRRRVGFSNASNRSSVRRGATRRASNCPSTYVVVDLETSGTDYRNDRIIEICALKIEDGVEQGCLCELVKSDPPSQEIANLTGITADDLANGRDLGALLDELLDFIEDAPLVMHNSQFDMGFLDKALEDFEIDELENNIVDTLAIARRRLPKATSYRLGDLCELVGIAHEKMHRARPDCVATNELFKELMNL